MGKLSELILTNRNENLLSMGYAFNFVDTFDYLSNQEMGDLSNPNEEIVSVMGLGTTKSSDASNSVKDIVIYDNFSIDKENPLWSVECQFTQSVPILDTKSNTYFLPMVRGEKSHFLAGSFGYKIIPGSLSQDCADAAANALGDSGFLVGCVLDMDFLGIEYLNKFHPLEGENKWNKSHTNALLHAGCLYAEYISSRTSKSLPLRIIGTHGFKSSVIKICNSIALLEELKDLKFGEFGIMEGTKSYQRLNESSLFVYPCADSTYDYLKAEISDYNPKSFKQWVSDSGEVKKTYGLFSYSYDKSTSYVKIFIPASKKSEAEFALTGKDIIIPESLYRGDSDFNYSGGKISQKRTVIDDSLMNYEGNFGNRVKYISKKLFEYCGGKVIGDEKIMVYSQEKRPSSFRLQKENPFTATNNPGGIRNKELYDILKICGNSNDHPFTNDCSSFVQMMIYATVGLKAGKETVDEVLSTQTLISRGPTVINKYINENYKAVLINFNRAALREGDILLVKGHAALYLGEKYANNINNNNRADTIEFHGKSNPNLHGFSSSHKYTHILRIVKSF